MEEYGGFETQCEEHAVLGEPFLLGLWVVAFQILLQRVEARVEVFCEVVEPLVVFFLGRLGCKGKGVMGYRLYRSMLYGAD